MTTPRAKWRIWKEKGGRWSIGKSILHQSVSGTWRLSAPWKAFPSGAEAIAAFAAGGRR